MYVDTNNLKTVEEIIQKINKYLNTAIAECPASKIPEEYSYSAQIKKIPSDISELIELEEKIRNLVKDIIYEAEKAEKENTNIASEITETVTEEADNGIKNETGNVGTAAIRYLIDSKADISEKLNLNDVKQEGKNNIILSLNNGSNAVFYYLDSNGTLKVNKLTKKVTLENAIEGNTFITGTDAKGKNIELIECQFNGKKGFISKEFYDAIKKKQMEQAGKTTQVAVNDKIEPIEETVKEEADIGVTKVDVNDQKVEIEPIEETVKEEADPGVKKVIVSEEANIEPRKIIIGEDTNTSGNATVTVGNIPAPTKPNSQALTDEEKKQQTQAQPTPMRVASSIAKNVTIEKKVIEKKEHYFYPMDNLKKGKNKEYSITGDREILKGDTKFKEIDMSDTITLINKSGKKVTMVKCIYKGKKGYINKALLKGMVY